MTKFLPLILPVKEKDLFELIKRIDIPERFKAYTKYFEKEFITNKINTISSWNYFLEVDNRTNNPCEGYNKKLETYFQGQA